MDIDIVRGSTNFLNIALTYEDGKPYVPKPGDFALFGVKIQTSDTELTIAKKATINSDGVAEIKLCPDDTKHLKCGKYCYDISVESGEDFYNAIENSPFYILPNITSKGCV